MVVYDGKNQNFDLHKIKSENQKSKKHCPVSKDLEINKE